MGLTGLVSQLVEAANDVPVRTESKPDLMQCSKICHEQPIACSSGTGAMAVAKLPFINQQKAKRNPTIYEASDSAW